MRKIVPYVLGITFLVLPIITYLYGGDYDEYAIGVVSLILSACILYEKPGKTAGYELMFIAFSVFCLLNTLVRGLSVSSLHCLTLLLAMDMYICGKMYSCSKRTGLWITITVALFHSLLIILQYVRILPSLSYYFEVSSVYGNPAPPAIIIVFGIVSLIYLRDKEPMKWAYYLMAAIMVMAVFMSSSRTAILSLAACWIYITLGRRDDKKKILYAIGVLLLLIPILYLIRPGSGDVRLLIWRAGMGMVGEKPLLGFGMESFAADYMRYQAKYFSSHPDSNFIMLATNHNQAYNEFLRILCEEGVIGLLLFFIPVVWVLIESSNLLLLFTVSAIVSFFLYTADITVWVCELSFLTGLLQKECRKAVEIKPMLHRSIFISCIFAIALLLANPVAPRQSSCYEDSLSRGLKAQQVKRYSEAEDEFMLAFHMIPCRITAPYLLFNLYKETDVEKAASMAKKIISFGEYKNEGNATICMRNEVRIWLRDSSDIKISGF